ncbi:MAG: antibiotic biosynthesis monooxygenase [Saprospiraceae bacterium]|nr:antibiotic biosynthesis monooxygenase [Saprospiraceae bacterium]
MDRHVYWHLEVNINPGKFETLKALMHEMVTRVQQHEPGTLQYAWSINKDRTECHLNERYADSDAALAHMKNFQEHFSERFMACVTPTRFLVYGHVTDRLRSAWPPGAVQIFEPLGGF